MIQSHILVKLTLTTLLTILYRYAVRQHVHSRVGKEFARALDYVINTIKIHKGGAWGRCL